MKNKIFIKRVPLVIPRELTSRGAIVRFSPDAILDRSTICSVKVITTNDVDSGTYENLPILLNPRTLGGCYLTIKKKDDSIFKDVSLASLTRESNYEGTGLPTLLNVNLSDCSIKIGTISPIAQVIMFEFSYYRI